MKLPVPTEYGRSFVNGMQVKPRQVRTDTSGVSSAQAKRTQTKIIVIYALNNSDFDEIC